MIKFADRKEIDFERIFAENENEIRRFCFTYQKLW